MARFLLRRFAAALLLVLLVLTVTFFLAHAAPGDPVTLYEDPHMTAAQLAHLQHLYGLDRPLFEQYLDWLGAVALHGDWGISFTEQRPVTRVIGAALPATLLLATAALVIEYGLGLLLGVAAARRRGSWLDHLIRFFSLLFYSQPVFWLGLMAVLLFSLTFPILPASHMLSVGADEMGSLARLGDLGLHLVLPALVLGLHGAAGIARFVRGSLLEVLSREYITTARAKGLSERRVVWVHGVRNALLPLIQVFALSLSGLLSGALVTEVVFAWPGLGRLTFEAILSRDYPLILATTALSAILVIAGNLLADLLQAWADPRLRDAYNV
jgi:peptide/nickel transport system permease protein